MKNVYLGNYIKLLRWQFLSLCVTNSINIVRKNRLIKGSMD